MTPNKVYRDSAPQCVVGRNMGRFLCSFYDSHTQYLCVGSTAPSLDILLLAKKPYSDNIKDNKTETFTSFSFYADHFSYTPIFRHPYFPTHMFRQLGLYSDIPMFWHPYITTPLCSDNWTYIPIPLCSETPIFRHSYVPTPLKSLQVFWGCFPPKLSKCAKQPLAIGSRL